MSFEKKIDKPDEVAFAKAISENLTTREDKNKLWWGLAAAYTASRVIRNAKNK